MMPILLSSVELGQQRNYLHQCVDRADVISRAKSIPAVSPCRTESASQAGAEIAATQTNQKPCNVPASAVIACRSSARPLFVY